MTGLWFTFAPDAGCLAESVGRFRDVVPDARVALLDDNLHPLPVRVLNDLAPDHYERTEWPREGNLRGWRHALCALEAYVRVADKTGAAGVFKLDCDTLLVDPSWIDTAAPLCGHDCALWPTVHGGLGYWIRRDAAAAILSHMRDRRWAEGGIPVNEDQVVSWWSMLLFGSAVKVIPFDCRIGRGFQFHRPDEDYSEAGTITFGNRMQLAGSDAERRSRAAHEMRRYRSQLGK